MSGWASGRGALHRQKAFLPEELASDKRERFGSQSKNSLQCKSLCNLEEFRGERKLSDTCWPEGETVPILVRSWKDYAWRVFGRNPMKDGEDLWRSRPEEMEKMGFIGVTEEDQVTCRSRPHWKHFHHVQEPRQKKVWRKGHRRGQPRIHQSDDADGRV